MRNRARHASTCALLAITLSACGGGGDRVEPAQTDDAVDATLAPSNTSDVPVPATPATPETPAIPPAPATPLAAKVSAPDGRAACGLPDLQAAAMARINAYRAAGADCRSKGGYASTGALAWNDALTAAATRHSKDMATQNYFSHTSRDGRTLRERIDAGGYAWRTIGENIAAGQRSIDVVVDGWMASDGHCANLMNPAFGDVGLACVASATSSYRTYWTLDLGAPR